MEYRLPEAVFWMNLNGITYLIRFNNMFCHKKGFELMMSAKQKS